MLRKSLCLLFLTIFVGPLLATTAAFNMSFDAYFDGNRYEFVIRHDMVEQAPLWNPDLEPNPPLSAAEALAKSKACISAVPTWPGTEWKFEQIGLGNAAGGWFWVSRYRLAQNDGVRTGAWPFMFCAILMDGTVVRPIITKQKT
jgi:hypothetical protein